MQGVAEHVNEDQVSIYECVHDERIDEDDDQIIDDNDVTMSYKDVNKPASANSSNRIFSISEEEEVIVLQQVMSTL